MFAAGELAMTAHDLALWDESLIAQSVLKPESYKQMFTEVKLKDGKGTHYGLGVEVLDRSGHRSIEHSGEVSGFVSDNEVLVDDGIAVAVLTNQDAASAGSEIGRGVMNWFLKSENVQDPKQDALIRKVLDGNVCARGRTEQVAVKTPEMETLFSIPQDIRKLLGYQ